MGISILAWLLSRDPNMGRGMITRQIWKCQYGSRDDNQINMEMPMY